jgi:hypothetical protein
MRTIYIEPISYKCCPTQNEDGVLIPYVTNNFDGKCDAYIEGFRFVPAGESWTRSDGVVFHGEMIAPWQPYEILAAAQAQYEATLAEMDAAYREGVNSI